jgi:hypothetical protein
VVTGMGMPEGIEEMIGAPVEEEGEDCASQKHEGQDEPCGKDSIHRIYLSLLLVSSSA